MAAGSHNKSTHTRKHKQRHRGSTDSRRPNKISSDSAAATFSDSQHMQDIFLICLNYITTLINAHWIIFSSKTLSTPSRVWFFSLLLLLCRSHSFQMQSIPLPGENPEAKDPLWTSHYPHHHITAVSSEARRSKADWYPIQSRAVGTRVALWDAVAMATAVAGVSCVFLLIPAWFTLDSQRR